VTSSVAGQRESGLYSSVCKLLLFLVLLAPVPALAQGGGGGGSVVVRPKAGWRAALLGAHTRRRRCRYAGRDRRNGG
jgi:hypothetical protein